MAGPEDAGPAPHEELVNEAYFKGIREGLWRYAWYKDGVQYVGTCGTTLKQAQAKVDQEEKDWKS